MAKQKRLTKAEQEMREWGKKAAARIIKAIDCAEDKALQRFGRKQ